MNWFDRVFSFDFPVEDYRSLLERWRQLLPELEALRQAHPAADWCRREDGRWSAQENLGHLADLESLWQARHRDFLQGAEVLSPADLQNRKTHEAEHNRRPLDEVFAELAAARAASLDQLSGLQPADFRRTARHPRLDQAMRLVDHLHFVAEHDAHHLRRIAQLCAAKA